MSQVPVKAKSRGDRIQEETEERVISLISSLFGECNIERVELL